MAIKFIAQTKRHHSAEGFMAIMAIKRDVTIRLILLVMQKAASLLSSTHFHRQSPCEEAIMCDATDFHSNQIQNKTKNGNKYADPFYEMKLNLWRVIEVCVLPFHFNWTTNRVTLRVRFRFSVKTQRNLLQMCWVSIHNKSLNHFHIRSLAIKAEKQIQTI